MSALGLILIGAWLVGSGWHGNAGSGLKFVFSQKKFVIWLLAIGILYGLSRVQKLHGAVMALAWLSGIAVVLKQWPTIQKSFSQLKQDFNL